MKVKRYDYRAQLGEDIPLLLADLQKMLEEGEYVLTRQVQEFETKFAEYIGVNHIRGVNSGTDAIVLALLALGIGRGDEVITQANTFNATVAAICLVGATPVLVDAEDESFLIDVDEMEGAITGRTRALLPVHLYGKPAPMNRIMAVAERLAIPVVEDAAQAHGARIGGKRVGSFGALACFSFHPSKNLAAAGDAGAVATANADIDQQVRRLRELGQETQNCHVVVGMNSKLDAIQARILLHKLPHLDRWNEKRRRVVGWYREHLRDLPLRYQEVRENEDHVFHLFQVRTDKRDHLLEYLRRRGIDATVRYPAPIHLQPAFSDRGWKRGQFPVAERLARELLCLPVHPDHSPDDVGYVSDTVRAFFGR